METVEPPSAWLDEDGAGRLADALLKSSGHALVHLASLGAETALPPAASWWREFARCFLSGLCHRPDHFDAQELAPLPPLALADFVTLIDAAPPMRGGEYLSPDLLEDLWKLLDSHIREAVSRHPRGLEG